MKMVVAWHRHSFQEVVWEVVVQHAYRMLSFAVICGGGAQAPWCRVGRCEVLRWQLIKVIDMNCIARTTRVNLKSEVL